ncbi:hypothetical protein ABZ330_28060 [Streptomyces sp. NPDC006172]|uniref:hypothetical protein n=1 Tax=Streptomyces sp. NPDC006172 TaxID=3154470 RepID=UPI0033EDD6CD
MTSVSSGVPLASVKGEIFEFFLRFLPEWAQIAVIGLILLLVVASWILKLKRKIDHRRAVRAGVPVHVAAQQGQRSGASYLGAYAPQNQQASQNQAAPAPQPAAANGPSGADFLGAYAPQNQQASQNQAAPAPQPAAANGPSGADFLGAYAPQNRSDDAR